MSGAAGRLICGEVVHRRVRPIRHELRYRVFSLLLDCERLEDAARPLRLFSVNRFNLVSVHERDHGDGGRIGEHLRGLASACGLGGEVSRFLMLCYPRVLGWVFNPLTVYYGLDGDGQVRLLVYEVRNTFGERETYVIPAAAPEADGVIRQSCDKVFYVSPFNPARGRYRFHIVPPGERVVVGVALSEVTGPVLNAVFEGASGPLTDRTLLAALGRTGWMTVKVSAGIRYEALKLWLKGLRPLPRPPHPRRSVTLPDPKKPI